MSDDADDLGPSSARPGPLDPDATDPDPDGAPGVDWDEVRRLRAADDKRFDVFRQFVTEAFDRLTIQGRPEGSDWSEARVHSLRDHEPAAVESLGEAIEKALAAMGPIADRPSLEAAYFGHAGGDC